jgi:hypothetical protein
MSSMARAVTNPLAAGVYRIDLPCELAPTFGKWRRAQKGKVHVIDLENGPSGTARVSFVVFAPPGAFPFGKLGKPTRGEVIGAMPDWSDVVTFALKQFPPARLALEGAELAAWVKEHAGPELAELRAALDVARTNIRIVGSLLTTVRDGSAPNPAAAMQQAAELVKQALELVSRKAAAIPGAIPRHVIDQVITQLNELAKAIAAAPGKALSAISDFASDMVSTFALPVGLAELGVVAMAAGGFLAWTEKKVTPTSRNLMLAGAASAFAAGFFGAKNVDTLLHQKDPK